MSLLWDKPATRLRMPARRSLAGRKRRGNPPQLPTEESLEECLIHGACDVTVLVDARNNLLDWHLVDHLRAVRERTLGRVFTPHYAAQHVRVRPSWENAVQLMAIRETLEYWLLIVWHAVAS